MVVPVLMISCHVSEKPKIGQVRPQIMITKQAITKAQAEPNTREADCDNR
jgi:hypothetical protein